MKWYAVLKGLLHRDTLIGKVKQGECVANPFPVLFQRYFQFTFPAAYRRIRSDHLPVNLQSPLPERRGRGRIEKTPHDIRQTPLMSCGNSVADPGANGDPCLSPLHHHPERLQMGPWRIFAASAG